MALSIRSDVESIDPSDVPLWVSEINMVQYFQAAIVTLMIYDTITTMDKEVKYFWSSPRKPVALVYFANRYIGVLGAISNLFWNLYTENMRLCIFARWTHNVANWLSIILIDYILMIRVLALYSGDRKLSVSLKTLLTLEATFKLAIFIYIALHQQVIVGGLATDVTVCGVNGTWPLKWSILDWSIPMVFGVVLMVLALYKAAEFWRMSVGLHGFTLIRVLIKDQVIYFALVVSCCVLNIMQLEIEVSNDLLANTLELLGSPSFLCVLGSRMLVNLKEAGELGVNAGTSYRLRTISELEFS